MNKADAIPSMRAAETNALRAVEREMEKSLQESYEQQQDQYGNYPLKPQSDQIDPVIKGLLTHLPPAGSVWPVEARKQWLELMEGSFRLIFKDKPAEPTS